MFEGGKVVGRRGVWLLIAVVLGVAFIVFVYPQIRAVHLQSKAGKLIEEHVAKAQLMSSETGEGFFYCIFPTLHPELSEENGLDQAIPWLTEAKSLAPKNVHSSFLLGQAYCLKGDYEQAVAALEDFLGQRPKNQLARAEVGFAYNALARSTTDPQIAQTYQSKSLQYLEQAGFSKESFLNLGDAAFKLERYQDGLVWYEISEAFSELEDPRLFRYALLQQVLHGSNLSEDQITNEMILELVSDLTIEPKVLFILSSGTSIETRVDNERTTGVLYANSQDAGILLDVNEAKKFCISGQVLDKPPAPTQIGVDVDFVTVKVLDLVNGNGDWVKFDFDKELDPGLHILSIKLMNDAIVDGVDRNAYFGPVIIRACQGD